MDQVEQFNLDVCGTLKDFIFILVKMYLESNDLTKSTLISPRVYRSQQETEQHGCTQRKALKESLLVYFFI